MRNAIHNVSTLILGLILPLTAFLVPIAFAPLTVDFFTPHKQLVLVALASIALLAWAVRTVIAGQVRLTLTPATLPAALLMLVYIVSSFLQSPNLIQAMLGQTSTIIALVVIFFTTTSVLDDSRHIRRTLIAAFTALALCAIFLIYEFSGVGKAFASIPWLGNPNLNPIGGPLPFLTLAIPLLPAMILMGLKSQRMPFKLALFIASALTIIAGIMAVSLLTPLNKVPRLVLLPVSAGWTIAIDVFKSLRTALLGTGPESFGVTFSQFKPFGINIGSFWNVRFNSSADELLTIVTTVGLLGLLAFAFTTLRPLMLHARQKTLNLTESQAIRIILALTLVMGLLFPATIALWTLTFVMLALVAIDLKSTNLTNEVEVSLFSIKSTKMVSEDASLPTRPHKTRQIFPVLVLVLTLLLIASAVYFHGKAYAAQAVYYRSLQSAAANKGTDTYNQQIRSIALNPFDSTVRMSYSQTNLALANAIAAQGNLSDQDKANVTQLIQQAIREAKAATVLNPRDAAVWENLANIYRQLVNLAQGADNWAVAAYTQAIRFDPLNPQLRLDLGGLYFSLRNYEEAINLFQQAVDAKPNWANAYYNLATAYKENKQYAKAYQMMQVVIQLVDQSSPDFAKAQTELGELQKMAQKEAGNTVQTPAPTSEQGSAQQPLATPTPLPKPSVSPIKLPDGAGLNIPSPTTTPKVSTTPTVTPTPTPSR